METINYKELNISKDISTTSFKFNEQSIEVLKYLPIRDKYDLIDITLQKAEEDGYYNPIKLDVYFNLNIVYLYTNLIFTEEERANEEKLYDELKSSGLMDAIISTVAEEEYNDLIGLMDDLINAKRTYKLSTAGVISTAINSLPEKAQAAADIVNSFDPDKFASVVNFAAAANGNRPIK